MAHGISVFRTPGEVIFGIGTAERTGQVAKRFGTRAMVLCGRRSAKESGALQTVADGLEAEGVSVVVFDQVGKEPTVDLVEEARAAARREGCDVLIGLGGGSVIDAAKCAAGLMHSSKTVQSHFDGQAAIPATRMPWLAVPTTAGAGAEATPNAVVTDEATNVKKSLRSWHWLADCAIVDPALTFTCPKSVTAHSGMDALTQAVESMTSRRATPLTEALSFEAAMQIGNNLVRAVEKGDDVRARTAVAWGATMAGIALANARLGAVHGFAHPVGTSLHVAHGLACAVLLPWVAEYNLDVAGPKYARLGRALGIAEGAKDDIAAAEAFVEFLRKLNERLEIPEKLDRLGLKREMIPLIVEQTLPSGSLAANPKPVSAQDLTGILLRNL